MAAVSCYALSAGGTTVTGTADQAGACSGRMPRATGNGGTLCSTGIQRRTPGPAMAASGDPAMLMPPARAGRIIAVFQSRHPQSNLTDIRKCR